MRKSMPRSQWDPIRKAAYERAGNRCTVCGANSGRLNGHEVWTFDDKKHVMSVTAKDVVALCDMCHAVIHFGNTRRCIEKGLFSFTIDDVINHAMKVNGWTKKQFEAHYKKQNTLFTKRSRHGWTVIIDGKTIDCPLGQFYDGTRTVSKEELLVKAKHGKLPKNCSTVDRWVQCRQCKKKHIWVGIPVKYMNKTMEEMSDIYPTFCMDCGSEDAEFIGEAFIFGQ